MHIAYVNVFVRDLAAEYARLIDLGVRFTMVPAARTYGLRNDFERARRVFAEIEPAVADAGRSRPAPRPQRRSAPVARAPTHVSVAEVPIVTEAFESMLQGGHPNSLGRTVEVVDLVLADPERLDELYRCYFSDDEVVRLRTSSALKRVCAVHPAWLLPYVDGLLGEVARIEQPSAQWTLAQLLGTLEDRLTEAQRDRATEVLKHNLQTATDWIVLIQTMQTLAAWGEDDAGLRAWLAPHLERLADDPRRSVAKKARQLGSVRAS